MLCWDLLLGFSHLWSAFWLMPHKASESTLPFYMWLAWVMYTSICLEVSFQSVVLILSDYIYGIAACFQPWCSFDGRAFPCGEEGAMKSTYSHHPAYLQFASSSFPEGPLTPRANSSRLDEIQPEGEVVKSCSTKSMDGWIHTNIFQQSEPSVNIYHCIKRWACLLCTRLVWSLWGCS